MQTTNRPLQLQQPPPKLLRRNIARLEVNSENRIDVLVLEILHRAPSLDPRAVEQHVRHDAGLPDLGEGRANSGGVGDVTVEDGEGAARGRDGVFQEGRPRVGGQLDGHDVAAGVCEGDRHLEAEAAGGARGYGGLAGEAEHGGEVLGRHGDVLDAAGVKRGGG